MIKKNQEQIFYNLIKKVAMIHIPLKASLQTNYKTSSADAKVWRCIFRDHERKNYRGKQQFWEQWKLRTSKFLSTQATGLERLLPSLFPKSRYSQYLTILWPPPSPNSGSHGQDTGRVTGTSLESQLCHSLAVWLSSHPSTKQARPLLSFRNEMRSGASRVAWPQPVWPSLPRRVGRMTTE